MGVGAFVIVLSQISSFFLNIQISIQSLSYILHFTNEQCRKYKQNTILKQLKRNVIYNPFYICISSTLRAIICTKKIVANQNFFSETGPGVHASLHIG